MAPFSKVSMPLASLTRVLTDFEEMEAIRGKVFKCGVLFCDAGRAWRLRHLKANLFLFMCVYVVMSRPAHGSRGVRKLSACSLWYFLP